MAPKLTHNYSSYLLRIWHATDGETPACRAFLEDLAAGRRAGRKDT